MRYFKFGPRDSRKHHWFYTMDSVESNTSQTDLACFVTKKREWMNNIVLSLSLYFCNFPFCVTWNLHIQPFAALTPTLNHFVLFHPRSYHFISISLSHSRSFLAKQQQQHFAHRTIQSTIEILARKFSPKRKAFN